MTEEYFPDPAPLSDLDAKGYVLDAYRDAVLRKHRSKNDNRNCFECGVRNPVWCSVTFGVYLCLDCSGNHRRKGVHISFVRSVDMDKFYPDQLVQMTLGGNAKALNFFKDSGMGRASSSGKAVDFTSRNALKYKGDLEKSVKAACLSFAIQERADANAAEDAPAEGGAAASDAVAASVSAPAPPEVTWTVGQRMQFRDSGNPTWKWGHVTHCKPLKIDYGMHPEVRVSPASKVLDAAAQKAIAFAAAPASAAPAPKVAAAPAAPAVKAAAAPTIRKAPPPAAPAAASNMVIRGATPATAPAAGYPGTAPDTDVAQPTKAEAPRQVAKELDLGVFDFGDSAPARKGSGSPKTSPALKLNTSPTTSPVLTSTEPAAGTPPSAPIEQPKKKVEEVDFDWDF